MADRNNVGLTSQVIAWLRFPLMWCVVMLHTLILGRPLDDGFVVTSSAYPLFTAFEHGLKSYVGGLAVPLFFFISGYLFFLGVEHFDGQVYLDKLRRRLHSLVVPYFLWNTLYLLLATAVGWLIPSWLTYQKSLTNMSLHDIVMAYWELSCGLTPLWFIRDLILINLFSPVIYVLMRHRGAFGVFLLVAVSFLLGWYRHLPVVFSRSLCLYMLGAWFSISGRDIVKAIRPFRYLLAMVYLLAVTLDACGVSCSSNRFLVNNAYILSGIFLLPVLVATGLRRNVLRTRKWLAESSFFVYMTHMFIIHLFVKVWMLMIPATELTLCMAQVVIPTIVSIVCAGGYFLMKRYLPGITDILVGRRRT